VRRLGALVVVVTVALAIAVPAHAALFFLFDRTTAEPGDVVSIRLGGTPKTYTSRDRRLPLKQAIRVYLVPAESAAEVRGRFDERLHFVGSVRPDRNTRGVLTFRLPPLDSGTYAVASWCPGCATYSRGSTFFAQTIPRVSRYRDEMALRIRMPDPAQSCPVTRGRSGNGLLSTTVPGPDGVLATRRGDDGSLGQKLWWLPKRGFGGRLDVRGERLDGPGSMRVLGVNWGHSSDGRGSWASAVSFPSEGCWRLSGRVGDVSLSYVVRVVEGCGDTYTPPPCGPIVRSSS
jgi:hypothetical protein